MAFATGALASTVVPRTLEERVQRADRVVLAQVVSQRTVNQGTPERPQLFTLSHVVVGDAVKGAGPAELDVVQLGGRWGLWEQHVSDDAQLGVGETALLLLTCPRSTPGTCRLAGLADAKLTVSGDQVFVRDMFTGAFSRQSLAALLPRLRAAAAAPPSPASPAPKAAGVKR